ncbi:unnamed protein product, partial [Effrenium voratum]
DEFGFKGWRMSNEPLPSQRKQAAKASLTFSLLTTAVSTFAWCWGERCARFPRLFGKEAAGMSGRELRDAEQSPRQKAPGADAR